MRCKQFLNCLAVVSFLGLTLAASCALAQEADASREYYLRLREQYESKALKAKDARTLSGLSLQTVALCWARAANDRLGPNSPERLDFKEFSAAWDKTKDWDLREIHALKFYWRALTSLAALEVKGDAKLSAELNHITGETQKRMDELDKIEHTYAEEKVVLSSAASTVLPLIIKSRGDADMERMVTAILNEQVEKAGAISRRQDIHYQAKMALLYLNNSENLARLTFLLGGVAGPPLKDKLGEVSDSWQKNSAGSSPPEALSLTWAATAQASLPLSFWLSKYPSGE